MPLVVQYRQRPARSAVARCAQSVAAVGCCPAREQAAGWRWQQGRLPDALNAAEATRVAPWPSIERPRPAAPPRCALPADANMASAAWQALRAPIGRPMDGGRAAQRMATGVGPLRLERNTSTNEADRSAPDAEVVSRHDRERARSYSLSKVGRRDGSRCVGGDRHSSAIFGEEHSVVSRSKNLVAPSFAAELLSVVRLSCDPSIARRRFLN